MLFGKDNNLAQRKTAPEGAAVFARPKFTVGAVLDWLPILFRIGRKGLVCPENG